MEADPGLVGQVGEPLGSDGVWTKRGPGTPLGRPGPTGPATIHDHLAPGTWAPWPATIGTAGDDEPGSDVQR